MLRSSEQNKLDAYAPLITALFPKKEGRNNETDGELALDINGIALVYNIFGSQLKWGRRW